MLRRGVRSVIERDSIGEVCGEAENGREGVDKVQQLHPNLVILDISMPVMNGIEAAAEIRRTAPHTKILILTMHDSPQMSTQALRSGADAVVVKGDVANKLTNTIRELLQLRRNGGNGA